MPRGDFIDREKARAAGRKSRRGKEKINLLKDAIGIDRTGQILKNIERNIDEFINSSSDILRLDATKAFCDYYKPKLSASTLKFKGDIKFSVNSEIADEEPEKNSQNITKP
jgi:hypothetical protein